MLALVVMYKHGIPIILLLQEKCGVKYCKEHGIIGENSRKTWQNMINRCCNFRCLNQFIEIL